jgi:hypothetical protein
MLLIPLFGPEKKKRLAMHAMQIPPITEAPIPINYPSKVHLNSSITRSYVHMHLLCLSLSLSLSLSHIHHLPSNHNSKRHSSNERYSTRSRDGTGTASFGSAAGTVVFHAVHLRGDLEDGPWGW